MSTRRKLDRGVKAERDYNCSGTPQDGEWSRSSEEEEFWSHKPPSTGVTIADFQTGRSPTDRHTPKNPWNNRTPLPLIPKTRGPLGSKTFMLVDHRPQFSPTYAAHTQESSSQTAEDRKPIQTHTVEIQTASKRQRKRDKSRHQERDTHEPKAEQGRQQLLSAKHAENGQRRTIKVLDAGRGSAYVAYRGEHPKIPVIRESWNYREPFMIRVSSWKQLDSRMGRI